MTEIVRESCDKLEINVLIKCYCNDYNFYAMHCRLVKWTDVNGISSRYLLTNMAAIGMTVAIYRFQLGELYHLQSHIIYHF
jgi:hypothetical protein